MPRRAPGRSVQAATRTRVPGREAELAALVGELERELAERERQLTATAGVLRAISQGQADPDRLLALIADSAVAVCDGADVVIFQIVGDRLVTVAHVGAIAPPPWLPVDDQSFAGRATVERRTIHIDDLLGPAGA